MNRAWVESYQTIYRPDGEPGVLPEQDPRFIEALSRVNDEGGPVKQRAA